MRSQPGLVPHTHDRDVAQTHAFRQSACGPMGCGSKRMLFRGRQDGRLFGHRQLLRPPPTRGIQQTIQPLLQPTPLPMQCAARAHSGLCLDLPQGDALGQQQQHGVVELLPQVCEHMSKFMESWHPTNVGYSSPFAPELREIRTCCSNESSDLCFRPSPSRCHAVVGSVRSGMRTQL